MDLLSASCLVRGTILLSHGGLSRVVIHVSSTGSLPLVGSPMVTQTFLGAWYSKSRARAHTTKIARREPWNKFLPSTAVTRLYCNKAESHVTRSMTRPIEAAHLARHSSQLNSHVLPSLLLIVLLGK